MTRHEKVTLVNELSASFMDANIIVCNYKGLSVREMDKLRESIRKIQSNIRVIKNKLASIALNNIDIKDLTLNDTNIFIWGKDQISLSKSVQSFADSNKEKFSIKIGYFDGRVVDSKYIEDVSKLPSKDELVGMLLSVWIAPLRYFITGIDNLRKEKEENNN